MDSFYKPAIKSDEEYNEMYNNIIAAEDWIEIKKNPKSIGFVYTLGEESIIYIVYSSKEKKAIVYKTCC